MGLFKLNINIVIVFHSAKDRIRDRSMTVKKILPCPPTFYAYIHLRVKGEDENVFSIVLALYFLVKDNRF